MISTVTFDSNVWEIIVDEDKRKVSDPIYTKLHRLIEKKIIAPFFFEGLATLETLKKSDRKEYIGNYNSGFSMSVDGAEVSNTSGSDAPVVSDYLNDTVPKALELGFKFTRLPRVGAPKLTYPDNYWAIDDKFEIGERQRRSFKCVRFIESLGAGKGELMRKLEANGGGLVQKTKADDTITEKKYASAVGEWVDGDALAANYGYGIDYFCTNDQAKGAGKSSIFHPDNLSKLESYFPVNVVTPTTLLARLGELSV
jgi:hypothetical protein